MANRAIRCLAVLLAVEALTARSLRAEPFGLVHSVSAPDSVLVGTLDDHLLLARTGGIEAVDPRTDAVAVRFEPPAETPSLGSAVVRVGAELWIGAPLAGEGKGAVFAYDPDAGTLLRSFLPDPQWEDEGGFGSALAATAGRVVVGAPFGEDNAVYVLDAATGATVRRVRRSGPGSFGKVAVASSDAFFVTYDQVLPTGEVHQLDVDGNLVRVIESPTPNGEGHRFGLGLLLHRGELLVGASGAGDAGLIYRYDPDSGLLLGTIEAPFGAQGSFGATLAEHGGGLLVGQPGLQSDPENFTRTVGVAYLLDVPSGVIRWSFQNPTYGGESEAFGHALASVGPHVVIGDPQDAPAATGIYVFADLAGCGDGVLAAPEQCEDGNTDSGDDCDANCTLTSCGNGVVTTGELCDDGNLADGDACASGCNVVGPLCGDGLLGEGEVCDDGNLVDGDGCDRNCTPTGCGNGILTAGEDCDDGNDDPDDLCPNDCNRIACGNGEVEDEEECDDGNNVDGDGCSLFCREDGGPYGVGVTDFAVTYHSPAFDADREVRVRVWYPAHALPPAGYYDPSLHDVPAARGRFPLIVSSHGFGLADLGTTLSSRYYHFARHGFMVAALVHPGDSFEHFPQDLSARPQDVRVVLDHLLDRRRVPSVLRGHVDGNRIVALGQSLGGITATAAVVDGFFGSIRDPRIKAVLGTGSENYVFTREQLATSRVPIMLVIGDQDSYFNGSTAIRNTYDKHRAPRYLVEVARGDHGVGSGSDRLPFGYRLGYLDYPLAFFTRYLWGDGPETALLQPGQETAFGDISYFADPGPSLRLGGGSRYDCMVGLATPEPLDPVADQTPRRLSCVDGSACDRDPEPGRCGFDVQVCVNAPDPQAIRCQPTDVARVEVASPQADAEIAALQDAIDVVVPTSDRRCTTVQRLTIDLPARGGKKGRAIRIRATSEDGRRDSDRFQLRCLRP